MKAIRKIVKSEHNILNISIPSDFCHKDLELIILPYENGKSHNEPGSQVDYKDFILSLPVMSDSQYAEWETEKSYLYSWLKS